MPDYRAPLREIDYLLRDVFDAEAHYAALEGGEPVSLELVDTIVRAAAEFAEQEIAPLFRTSDE